MSHRKMSQTGYIIAGFKWYNSYCIEQTIVNVNIVIQYNLHPSWISSGFEKNVFPFHDKIVLIVCERYHHNGCRYHIDQLLKRKTMYPFPMSANIATVAGGHLRFYMSINTTILINIHSLLMHQCDLNSWRWRFLWKIFENRDIIHW